MRKVFLGFVCALITTGVLLAQTLSPQVRAFVKVDAPVIALTHVRVIDGTGAAAREDQTLIICKGKIESVSDAAAANVPQGANVIDLHGYSVIPGLVGMHDHMFYPVGNGIFGEMGFTFPRLYLAGGVTTTGLKLQAEARGIPEHDRFTCSEKPFCEVTVRFTAPNWPGASDNDDGLAVTVNPGSPLSSAETPALAADPANAATP